MCRKYKSRDVVIDGVKKTRNDFELETRSSIIEVGPDHVRAVLPAVKYLVRIKDRRKSIVYRNNRTQWARFVFDNTEVVEGYAYGEARSPRCVYGFVDCMLL